MAENHQKFAKPGTSYPKDSNKHPCPFSLLSSGLMPGLCKTLWGLQHQPGPQFMDHKQTPTRELPSRPQVGEMTMKGTMCFDSCILYNIDFIFWHFQRDSSWGPQLGVLLFVFSNHFCFPWRPMTSFCSAVPLGPTFFVARFP